MVSIVPWVVKVVIMHTKITTGVLSKSFNFYLCYYCVCVYIYDVYICKCTCHDPNKEIKELRSQFLSTGIQGSKTQSGLCSKYFYLLSHLTDPVLIKRKEKPILYI